MAIKKGRKNKGQKIKVEVTVVPTEGKPSTKSVEVEASGASVEQVLKSAGVSADRKDLLVNNQPATLATHVGPKDVVDAKEVKVQAAERPQGS